MGNRLTLDSAEEDGGAIEIPGIGIILAAGIAVPADGALGYAPGCIFIHTDGTTLNDTTYTNVGTLASCNFDAQSNI